MTFLQSRRNDSEQNNTESDAVALADHSANSANLQRNADLTGAAQRKPNLTGLPDSLKSGVENLSGYSMDNVRVHYNSTKPATVQALAYTQGTDIHVAPGQEQHLPHEAWHVAQQMAGRVQPTTNVNGMPINDNAGLEHEADVMGTRAVQRKSEFVDNRYELGIRRPPQQNPKVDKRNWNKIFLQTSSNSRQLIQLKTTGVVVEMIAPAQEGMKTDQELISQIEKKHFNLHPALKNKVFYAIGFNKRQGNSTGDLKKDAKWKTEKRVYKKLDQEIYGYVPDFLRWGSDTWIWPNLDSNNFKKHVEFKNGKTDRPMRLNFPFRAWRNFAHKIALGHWGANKWVNESSDRDLVYKTADSDQDWKEPELTQGLDIVNNEIGLGKSATSIDATVGTKPLVLTTPYHWSKGRADVTENLSYKYQKYLDDLNGYEVDKRKEQYDKHPLSIYYPEPTTYFTKAAADIDVNIPCGVCEGAAKISAIVFAVVNKKKEENVTIDNYNKIGIEEWKNMFKFLFGSKLTSDPGERARSLANLYQKIKNFKEPTRQNEIKKGMKDIDQSAYQDGAAEYNLTKNTTFH